MRVIVLLLCIDYGEQEMMVLGLEIITSHVRLRCHLNGQSLSRAKGYALQRENILSLFG